MHGDDTPFGSVHRVELFDKFPAKVTLADDVSVMNRAATEDVRSLVWPVVSQVLRGGAAPNGDRRACPRRPRRWVQRDAPRLDADQNGQNDDAGAPIMDAVWRPIAEAVMRPVYGDLLGALDDLRGLGGLAGESYVDKDLRTLLDPAAVNGKFQPAVLRPRVTRSMPDRRCGRRSTPRCSRSSARRARTRPRGGATRRAPASCPASSPTRSARRTARPSNRCSSSHTRGSGDRTDQTSGSMSSARACRSSAFDRCVAAASFCCSAARLSRFARAARSSASAGAPVGFELAHLGEVARFARFAPTGVHFRQLAAARREHDDDDGNDDNCCDDDRECCVHAQQRAQPARIRNAAPRRVSAGTGPRRTRTCATRRVAATASR